VQMVAAHHGIWVSQQLVRDLNLNHGELLLDEMGSVESVLDRLGFSHTTWSLPTEPMAATAGWNYRSHAQMFSVWVKQNIAQGQVPIYGAKIAGGADPEYDHIMPAYAVQFWANITRSVHSSSPASSATKAGVLLDGKVTYHLPQGLGAQASSMWQSAAGTAVQERGTADSPAVTAAGLGDDAALDAQDLLTLPSDAALLEEEEEDEHEHGEHDKHTQHDEHDKHTQPVQAAQDSSFSAPDASAHQQVPVNKGLQDFEGNPRRDVDHQQAGTNQPAQAIPPQSTGWLPSPDKVPNLTRLPGLYSFNAADVLLWCNSYGSEMKRAMGTAGFFASRSKCPYTETAGGCISTDSPSYAVAMGGLVQPAAAVSAGSTAATHSASEANQGLSLPAAASMLKPLRLSTTAWSRPEVPANSEPLPQYKAAATAYQLDVSRCAPDGQPLTVFRFDSYLAFRSTASSRATAPRAGTDSVDLANPSTVEELVARCTASKAYRRATFVQSSSLSVGSSQFGPFAANGSTYFVCVTGAVA